MIQKLLLASLFSAATFSAMATEVINHKSPYCGCCSQWAKHMEGAGFTVKEVYHENMETVKAKFNIPAQLTSCHTAEINGYLFEGHVPAEDIQAFLANPPADARGLSVPGMPVGSPGMNYGDKRDAYSVFVLGKQGKNYEYRHYNAL
ncbi:DUF411 domain-containing protein [Vibrio mangrovi]|uniref:DUF411 domain-containing protein n=1 Tax=Vibrio mangrovi TaxID=474394 RepID=A0A1Y6IWG2_9VIBR|nr:DUF411 domain-containing protein [Vibrio mangrovi]MDW6001591.1 DUF411 domain-containing protein [Vibrio mangrovi]SMS00383.1 hypothetical protein VIM7927_01635 [Vibrio mangrovi]